MKALFSIIDRHLNKRKSGGDIVNYLHKRFSEAITQVDNINYSQKDVSILIECFSEDCKLSDEERNEKISKAVNRTYSKNKKKWAKALFKMRRHIAALPRDEYIAVHQAAANMQHAWSNTVNNHFHTTLNQIQMLSTFESQTNDEPVFYVGKTLEGTH